MGLFSKSKPAPKKEHSGRKSKHSTGRSICCDNLSFAAKESYKRLRTNVIFSFPDEEKCRIIGITSAQPNEGKTISCVNLAYSLSELGHRVLLIDGDMRRSSAHIKLNLKQSPGLSNLLVETSDVKSVINEVVFNNNASFDVICGGNAPPNPSELLCSARMVKLLSSLSGVYDYILIDLPPIGAVIDPISISRNVDGMIIVVREQHTSRFELTDSIEQLRVAGVKILGFINNGSLEGTGKNYKYKRYGIRYGYGYGYGNPYYGNYGNYGNYGSYVKYGNYGDYGSQDTSGKDSEDK